MPPCDPLAGLPAAQRQAGHRRLLAALYPDRFPEQLRAAGEREIKSSAPVPDGDAEERPVEAVP